MMFVICFFCLSCFFVVLSNVSLEYIIHYIGGKLETRKMNVVKSREDLGLAVADI